MKLFRKSSWDGRGTNGQGHKGDLTPDSDLLAYLQAATDQKGDTESDRAIEIYGMLRRQCHPAQWHKSASIRAFIAETQHLNPYTPAIVREREIASRDKLSLPRRFVEAWQAAGLPRDRFSIDVSDFERVFAAAPTIISDFKQSNIHDTDYFFCKLAEWYLTIATARELNAENVLDLGAAYHGFATVATNELPGLSVTMVDLVFPAGRSKFGNRIFQLGSDAGDLQTIDTNSVDLVCAHNAFEHFSGESDTRCAREIERILKPGGVALISPLFTDEVYSLSINPFSAFVANYDERLRGDLQQELTEPRLRVDYRPNIISPFSRRYDLAALRKRILDIVPNLEPTLVTPRFFAEGFGEDSREMFGLALDRDVFDRRAFHCLRLRKRQ